MRDPPSPRRPLSSTIGIAGQLLSLATHASLPPSPLSRCGGTASPYGAHISPSLLMWSGMVGAPSGARAAAAAAPSHGARVSQGGGGRIQPWGLWRARPELCIGAARNPRPARRARCRGARPRLAGRSQGHASASTLARTEGARPGLARRAAKGARPPPRWPGRRARGRGSRPPPCRPPDSTPDCHRAGSALKKCLK